MKINEGKYKWSGSLSKRMATKYLILHHRAGNGDAQSIHKTHLANGWSGIGYHFYVRKNGDIFYGRPVETVGAHCTGFNANSIGVCFEGDFQNETMSEKQLNAGRELIAYIKEVYRGIEVKKHEDFNSTLCPGKNFPFKEITTAKKQKLTSANDIIWELMNGNLKIEINDVDKAVKSLEEAERENSSLYWILYKIVNG